MTTRYYEEIPCEHGQMGNHQMPGVDVFEHGDVRCPGGQRRELANGEQVEWCEEHNAQMVSNRDQECWDAERLHPCRIVSKLLINPPTEEER